MSTRRASLASRYHGHLCPGPRRHVRELERHVAAADKENPRGEDVELEELIARRQVLAARELEVSRLGPGRYMYVPGFEYIAVDGDGGGANEVGATMESPGRGRPPRPRGAHRGAGRRRRACADGRRMRA